MQIKQRIITYAEAINEALVQVMTKDKNVIVMGLGVDDPGGVFGTTKNLVKKFPKNRIFDLPTSENAFTGFAIGLALGGKKPVITHQRVEFSILSMEQIINQAAKWFYMSAGKASVPLVIRLIIGRGWGQGPQHSQSLEVLFAHIPGLKVVCPSTPFEAKGMLIQSIEDKNPVIFFEHRWLHITKGYVPKKYYKIPLGNSKLIKMGKDITIVSFSYMMIECLRIHKTLKENNISSEIINIYSLNPLEMNKIYNSVKKTKKILVVDNGWKNYGIGAEIIASVNEKLGKIMKISCQRIGVLQAPIPSTRALAKYSYPNKDTIIQVIEKLIKKKIKVSKKYNLTTSTDQPDSSFLGPF
jgi:pyruvate/2-oxoglutarate/acetoin dehydrogenase E1 component